MKRNLRRMKQKALPKLSGKRSPTVKESRKSRMAKVREQHTRKVLPGPKNKRRNLQFLKDKMLSNLWPANIVYGEGGGIQASTKIPTSNSLAIGDDIEGLREQRKFAVSQPRRFQDDEEPHAEKAQKQRDYDYLRLLALLVRLRISLFASLTLRFALLMRIIAMLLRLLVRTPRNTKHSGRMC